MEHPCPIEALPEAAHKPLRGPAPLRMMVARGLAPLPPVALVSVLYAFSYDADAALAAAARATLEKLPAAVLDAALGHATLPAPVLDDLADRFRARPDVVERVILHPSAAGETVARVASRADETLCERIATNEQRLLAHPAIIEALYLNRALRMSTADRIVELAARNGVELGIPGFKDIVAALRDQLIPEAGEESPGDAMFREAIADAESVEGEDEDVVERDDEGEEKLKEKFHKVEIKLGDMTITEKIRAAMIGTPSQRMILVRSPNRVISRAAIESPKMQESEAVKIAASRQVSDEVLRYIANKRDWSRMHQTKVHLVFNPKTPLDCSLRLLVHLREVDLRALARSKNVPQALKTGVAQLTSKREKKNG